MLLQRLPRPVDWLILEVGLGIGRKAIVMDLAGVWVYTGDRTQWEVLLLKLPRSVGWFLDLIEWP